ncbi:MAG: hypothetical protein K9I69_08040 [Ignavibacteriales bacterium]|nr:hypothetical protein [Ignavibacteriales bacterium]MCF8306344.1 hypothetical protein [Ignavibacteriales bacterium]MCF8435801.1 hypothetical protein [Ignavibacteriales bacterium]
MYKMLIIFVIAFITISNCLAQDFTSRVDILDEARNSQEINNLNYSINNASGDFLFRLNIKSPYDAPFPNLTFFSSGVSILAYPLDGKIEYYDLSGNLITVIKDEKSGADYERTIFVSTSDDLAAILVSEPGTETSYLMIADMKGRILNKKVLSYSNYGSVFYSKMNSVLIVSKYDWESENLVQTIEFYNGQLEIVTSRPGFFTKYSYDGYTDEIVLSDQKSFSIINLKNNETQFFARAGDIGIRGIIHSCVALKGRLFILSGENIELEGGEWKYGELTLFRLSDMKTPVKIETFSDVSVSGIEYFESAEILRINHLSIDINKYFLD